MADVSPVMLEAIANQFTGTAATATTTVLVEIDVQVRTATMERNKPHALSDDEELEMDLSSYPSYHCFWKGMAATQIRDDENNNKSSSRQS